MSTSNSTNVNISNLPQLQIVSPGSFFIVQTPNGTEIIDFANINFVKTDLQGNALVPSSLSAGNTYFVSINTPSISAANFSSLGRPGINALPGYYNTFQVTNGLVTSATYIQGSPEYQAITQTFIPAVTSYQTTIYTGLTSGIAKFADQSGIAVVGINTSNSTVTINNFFSNYPISVANITPAHFTLAPTADSGTVPYITNISSSGQNLSFQVNLGGSSLTGTQIYWRLLVSY